MTRPAVVFTYRAPFLRIRKLSSRACVPAQLSCAVAHARSVGRSSVDVLSGGRTQK